MPHHAGFPAGLRGGEAGGWLGGKFRRLQKHHMAIRQASDLRPQQKTQTKNGRSWHALHESVVAASFSKPTMQLLPPKPE